jgi:hypothetical protein
VFLFRLLGVGRHSPVGNGCPVYHTQNRWFLHSKLTYINLFPSKQLVSRWRWCGYHAIHKLSRSQLIQIRDLNRSQISWHLKMIDTGILRRMVRTGLHVKHDSKLISPHLPLIQPTLQCIHPPPRNLNSKGRKSKTTDGVAGNHTRVLPKPTAPFHLGTPVGQAFRAPDPTSET